MRGENMNRELLINLRKLLEVYPRADREKWNEKRKNAIIVITKELNKLDNDLELFEHFWEMYPVKKNKPDAKKAWQQTINNRPDLSTILNVITKQTLSESWMRGFIPMPASWLRGHRWNDEIEVKLPGVVNEKPWHETASGIEAKGRELGLDPSQFNTFPEFRAAVMQKSLKAA
jgi:hypothetical protein